VPEPERAAPDRAAALRPDADRPGAAAADGSLASCPVAAAVSAGLAAMVKDEGHPSVPDAAADRRDAAARVPRRQAQLGRRDVRQEDD